MRPVRGTCKKTTGHGSPETLGALLERRAHEEPDRVGYVFLADGERQEHHRTYGELDAAARAIASRLREVAEPGDRALLLHPPGLEFLDAFFGCVYAGVVAAPATLPIRTDGARTLHSIVADCAPRTVLSTAAVADAAAGMLSGEGRATGSLEWIATDQVGPIDGAGPGRATVAPRDLAFLQYTSGSTAAPRGVMIEHANVMANLEALWLWGRPDRDSVSVQWVPQYHDMGLAIMLSSLYKSFRCVFMSPLAFLERPMRWLEAVSRHRGTWSAAPNFAFDLCARRATDADVERLDLSSLGAVINGSEPVRADTVDRFVARFAPCGFRREAMRPCFGLAEHVVFVAGTGSEPPAVARVDADALSRGRVEEATSGSARELVACGRPSDERQEVLIVSPDTCAPCAAGEVGEIWVRGPSVARGYWNQPDASDDVFGGALAGGGESGARFLRTGDLGFLWRDQLVVAGRIKDLIIVGGANHYPQDIERTVEDCHESIRPGGVAAFAVEAEGERVVVAAEVRSPDGPLDELPGAVRAAVAREHGLAVEGVALLPPRSAPRTSSGKVRRGACRAGWLSGELESLARWESAVLRAPATPAEAAPPLEARFIAHVERVLHGRRPATADEPLSSLGISSLEATDLHAAVEAELGVAVPLSGLLEGWSVRELLAGARRRETSSANGAGAWERSVNPRLGRLLRRLRVDKQFVRGAGPWLFDGSGAAYLDLVAGNGSVPFGHDPAEVWGAIRAAGDTGRPSFVQPADMAEAGELAERLTALAPGELRYAAFGNSGAEAVEAAIKLVRAATGRQRVLATTGGFHGKTLGALSATGRARYQAPFGAPAEGFEHVPYGDLDALERALAASPVAGFVVEPIQGEGGVIEPPAGYLAKAQELCRRSGTLLVVDEVQTGLGRTGAMFACEWDGVEPDVLLVAKALGGGLLPIGAALYGDAAASQEFWDLHSSTFAGGGLAVRAALATLDVLERDDRALVRQVAECGARLRSQLEALRERHPRLVRDVRGRGLLLGLELTSERSAFGGHSLLGVLAAQERLGALLASRLLNVDGIRTAPTLLRSSVIRIEPPLTFPADLCSRVGTALERALDLLEHDDTVALMEHLLEDGGRLSVAGAASNGHRPLRPASPAVAARPGEPRWAFLAHPLGPESYRDFDPSLGALSDGELTELSAAAGDLLDPFVAGSTRVSSAAGASAVGHFVVVPRTTQELQRMPRHEAVELVREGIRLARERGAQVVGLGGHLSIVTGAGIDLPNDGVAVTTGNVFTAVAAAQTVAQALERVGGAPCEATAAVIGAGGSVGATVCGLLAADFGRLVLVGNPERPDHSMRRLRAVAERLVLHLATGGGSGALARAASEAAARGVTGSALVDLLTAEGQLELGIDAAELVADADVVVTATSQVGAVLPPEALAPGAIACDLSRPANFEREAMKRRPDVLVIDAGEVAVPGRPDLGWRFGLPAGSALACMCEPMLIALEGRGDCASIGADVAPELTSTLRDCGKRHGFATAAPRSFGRPVEAADWERVRSARAQRVGDVGVAMAGGGAR